MDVGHGVKGRSKFTPRGGPAGFTLLEVLLANMLMGLVLLAAYGLFAQGLSLQTRGKENLFRQRDFQTLVTRLRLELAQAVSSPWHTLVFQGGAHRLTFITDAGGELARVTWEWNAEKGEVREGLLPYGGLQEGMKGESVAAVRRSGPETGERRVILARGVADFRLRYLDAQGIWQERWDSGDKRCLPRAVELQCAWTSPGHCPEGKTLTLPPLILPIPAGGAVGDSVEEGQP